MDQQTGFKAQGVARITTPPELDRTLDGRAFCRFMVAADAGPASRPVVKSIYVRGNPALKPSEDLPVRIEEKLGVGCLVYVEGTERQRKRKVRGVEFIESVLDADHVGLRAYAQAGEGA
jgi:hypothetical protein